MKNFISHNKQKQIALILLIVLMACYFIFFSYNINNSYALSKYGSNSDEVKQIQTKLKRWGYYTGSIDGIFGSRTLAAVKWFQSANRINCRRNCRTKNSCCNGNTKQYNEQ